MPRKESNRIHRNGWSATSRATRVTASRQGGTFDGGSFEAHPASKEAPTQRARNARTVLLASTCTAHVAAAGKLESTRASKVARQARAQAEVGQSTQEGQSKTMHVRIIHTS